MILKHKINNVKIYQYFQSSYFPMSSYLCLHNEEKEEIKIVNSFYNKFVPRSAKMALGSAGHMTPRISRCFDRIISWIIYVKLKSLCLFVYE
jgi:hypothetical protein